MQTAWGIGDTQWPLTAANLEAFQRPFREKSSGLEMLQTEAGHPAVDLYLRKMAEGGPASKYHSTDAATAFSKARLGHSVDAHNSVARGTWNDVATCAVGAVSCKDVHPGLCAARDQVLIGRARGLVSTLPRQDALLRFQRNGLVYFFRFIIGG